MSISGIFSSTSMFQVANTKPPQIQQKGVAPTQTPAASEESSESASTKASEKRIDVHA
jgi:hypothetical protein